MDKVGTAAKRGSSRFTLMIPCFILALFLTYVWSIPSLHSPHLPKNKRPSEIPASGPDVPFDPNDDSEKAPADIEGQSEDEVDDEESTKRRIEIDQEVDDEDEIDEEQADEDVERSVSDLTTDRMCIVYDRPPRTGSTTISIALKNCLKNRYTMPHNGPREVRPFHISNMLKLTEKKVGVYTRHMYMNMTDVDALRKGCEKLVYITSTKPMKDRIWSYAKHRQAKKEDPTMTEEKLEKAMAFLSMDGPKRAEEYLEAYPYIGGDEKSLNVPEKDRMVPNYVIRSDVMSQDLGKLLKAFGCESEFQSKNTRETVTESTKFLEDLELAHNDRTYVRLHELAKVVNDKGLEMAKAFA